MSNAFPLPLSAPQLLARAREIAKVDLEDEAALGPLTVLVDSFNREACLHQAGALSVQERLLRSLCNRLRMLRDFAAHPEIHEQVVRAPIFIAGFLRTGSTKLVRLLAASGDFNDLPLWKALNPGSVTGVPGEDPAPRIADTEQFLRDLYTGSPEAAVIHEQGALMTEEESYIFVQDLRCAGYLSYANVPSYLQWLAGQDLTSTYRYLLDTLKYLQWQGLADPRRRWLLKSPFHLGQERLLARVFPDATLLFTHRPPAEFLPSMCSLMAGYMKWHTDHTAVDGASVVGGFAHTMESHFAFRDAPTLSYLDLDYRDVTADSGKVIRQTYDRVGSSLTARALAAMADWERANPIHKHGSHRYAPESFGISDAFIHDRCRRYEDFYRTTFGNRDA